MSRPRDVARAPAPQVLAHLADPSRIELRLWARNGWRFRLEPNDRMEIRDAGSHELLGQLSGDAVHALVVHHLATAALGARLLDQMATLRRPPIDPDAHQDDIPAEPSVLATTKTWNGTKGMEIRPTMGQPLRLPMGRTVNALGQPVDGKGPVAPQPREPRPRMRPTKVQCGSRETATGEPCRWSVPCRFHGKKRGTR